MPTQETDRQLESNDSASPTRARRFVLGPESLDDPATVTALYDEMYPELRAHAMKLLRSPERAGDAIQTAFANTIAALRRGRRIEEGDRWLHRCVRNACLYELRVDSNTTDAELREVPDPGDLEELAHWRSRCTEMYEAVDELPKHVRTALLLSEVHGLTYREVASEMKRSVDSVRALIFRARSHLREIAGPQAKGLFAPLVGTLEAGRELADSLRRAQVAIFVRLGDIYAQFVGGIERALGPAWGSALPAAAIALLAAATVQPGSLVAAAPATTPERSTSAQTLSSDRVPHSSGNGDRRDVPGNASGGRTYAAPRPPAGSSGGSAPGDGDSKQTKHKKPQGTKRPGSDPARASDVPYTPPATDQKEPGAPPVEVPTPGDRPGANGEFPDPPGDLNGYDPGSPSVLAAAAAPSPGANGEQPEGPAIIPLSSSPDADG